MFRHRNKREQGSALAATLAAIALLIPLGALAVLQARTSLLIAENLRGDVEALYAAEAALEWATAILPPDIDPEVALSGPDGRAGTGDDGIFPFGSLPSITEHPRVTEIRVDSPVPDILKLTATGSGFRNAASTLECVLVRTPGPYSPGAAYAGGGAIPVLGTSTFLVSGLDHVPSDPIGTPSGNQPALYAVGLTSTDAVAAAVASLSPQQTGWLTGREDAPSIGYARGLDLTAVIDRAENAAAVSRYSGGDIPPDLVAGEPAAPQITIVDGNADLIGTWTGHGILIVRGRLLLEGQLDFSGLVIAEHGFRVESGGQAGIYGALWLSGPPLEMRGSGGIAACSQCLEEVDAAFTGILPHAFLARGWRQVD